MSGGYVPGVVNGGKILTSPTTLPASESIVTLTPSGSLKAVTSLNTYDTSGTASAAVSAHVAATDPHGDRAYTNSALAGKADASHTHPTSQVVGLDSILAGKAETGHVHDLSDITGLGTAAAFDVPNTGDAGVLQVVLGSDTRLTDSRTPSAHTHSWEEISDTPTSLAGYGILDAASASHGHTIGDVSGLQAALDGKASSTHTHGVDDVLGLGTLLDGKAAASHTHTLSQVTDAGTSASKNVPSSGNAASTEVVMGNDTRLTDSRTPASHAHGNITNAGAIGSTASLPLITGASGVITVGSFGTSSGTFCQGNDSRLSDARTPVSHTHAISEVTGLQTALDGKASTSHTHAIGDVTGLQTALDGKASSSHTHLLAAITDAGTAASKNFPASGDAAAGEVVLGNDSRLTDSRTPTAHNQAWSTITSTPTTLAGYGISDAAASSHSHAISDVTGLQTALDGKASTSHSHDIADVTGLQTALDGKSSTSHNHTVDSLSNVSISGKASGDLLRWNGSNWINYPDSNFAAASHSHTFASLTSKPTTLSGYGITDAQPLDSELTALAGLTSAADQLPYFTGSGTAGVTTLTSAARSVLDDTTVAAMATTLGLGTASNVQFANLVLGSGTGSARLNIDSGAGSSSGITWKVGGVLRWLFYTTNAETGSDAGSDLVFGRAFTDAGVGIDNPITITRAAGGLITFARPLSCNSDVTIGSSLTFNDNRHIVVNTSTGTKIGTGTTQKLGFWNATPVVQPSGAAQAAVATTAATNSSPYGFTTAAQADAIVTLVNAIRTALVNTGIMKGSA
jgi:hypothetical protein